MAKLEKYYNYIVDDLVSKTNVEDMYIHTPYGTSSSRSFFSDRRGDIRNQMYSTTHTKLLKHLVSKYGIQDEEMYIIWDLYSERIKTLISNG